MDNVNDNDNGNGNDSRNDSRNTRPDTSNRSQTLPVTFSTLLLSLGSSAILAMGLEKNPHTNKYEKDLDVARFNIDMLKLLQEKTKNNLTKEEQQFMESMVSDLQLKFVYVTHEQEKQAKPGAETKKEKNP
jgi:hypothetical protein